MLRDWRSAGLAMRPNSTLAGVLSWAAATADRGDEGRPQGPGEKRDGIADASRRWAHGPPPGQRTVNHDAGPASRPSHRRLLPSRPAGQAGRDGASAGSSAAVGGRMALMRAMVIRRPGEKLRLESGRFPSPVPTRCCSACLPAASAAPISISSTASCRCAAIPSSPATRSSARSRGWDRGASGFELGQRVGVPWLGASPRSCRSSPR